VKKLFKSHKGQKKLDFLVASARILALLAIFPAAASVSSLYLPLSPKIGSASAQVFIKTLEMRCLEINLAFYENLEPLKEIGQYIDIIYMLVGIGAVILISFIYTRMIRGENELITKLYIAVPVLCIAIAELLIFLGRIKEAVWIHIWVLLALSLSNISIKDPKIHKIHMALMLLPILRLVNLSMPIFFETTLYTFILCYTPLAIPLVAIIIQQRNSLEQIGITKKHFLTYMILAVPLSFLLGLGEYLTIRPGHLIPDPGFENLLMLTFIMVFFVGLVEELIFRSLLQTRLEQALSAPKSLLITSFLFGLMHSGYGTYYEMLYTGFVGLVIGFIFYKTKSLPFVTFLHGFVNVFLFGILPFHLIGWI